MTAPEAAPLNPPAAQSLEGTDTRRQPNVAAVVGLAIGVVLWILLSVVKLLAVIVNNAQPDDSTAAKVIGILGIATLFAAILPVILGHIGLAVSKRTLRGRATAAIALTLGYTHVLLWLLRIVVSVLAAVGVGDDSDPVGTFLTNNFYWA